MSRREPHAFERPHPFLLTFVVALAGGLLLSGCSASSSTPSASGSDPTVQAPTITITPSDGSAVAPDAEVEVRTDGGRLESVSVTAADGSVVPGELFADATVWRSDSRLLQFGSRYTVTASASSGQTRADASSVFRVKETKALRAFVSPDNRTVGVGMPVTVKLTAAPKKRRDVESRLSVTTSVPVDGSWHWFSDTELHWRPKEFWPAGTEVKVKAALKGVRFGKNTYGDHTTRARFRIGDAQVSTVDVANHTMTVTRNDKVVRRIPITTGEPAFATRAGIKVIISKEEETIMDSSTVDIPDDSPDAYRLKVKNAMRLTWSGEYLHAAPWSVASQGRANVSHGCTGMSDANAQWMFDFSQVGDVVKYINSNRPLEQGNGYTDWNVPWSEWLAGSSLV